MAQTQTSAPGKELTETVLVRHPLPKYNFQGKKLPKEVPKSRPTTTQGTAHSSSSSSNLSTSPQPQLQLERLRSSPAAASFSAGLKQNSSDTSLDRKSAAVGPFLVSADSALKSERPGAPGSSHLRPLAAVVAPNVRSRKEKTSQEAARVVGEALSSVSSKVPKMKVLPSAGERGGKDVEVMVSYLPSPPAISAAESVDIPVPDAALLAHVVEGPGMAEKLERAEKEIAMLRSQLDVQLKVNSEIKRLLVASVGEDFERKVENLARDRAELALELGDFSKKMTEDYENLDQISIQADMWRSKYLASRVMVEELASARAFYSSQFQDSQQALQELLNERYELRTGLLYSYKILQQVKEAFDPLNSQKSHSLPSTNALDLSKHIKQLAEAVRFRLLPAHAGSHVTLPLEESWESTMTKAELLAYEQLSKESAPPSFKHSLPSYPSLMSATPSPPPPSVSKSFERFHPLVRHDNLTVNCCGKCKGEISVA